MSGSRFRNRLGGTAARTPAPLPQDYPPHTPATPVRIVHGFLTTLPGRSRIFFQRQFFSNYPRPIQQGGSPPFPRTVNIATIEAPREQAIVIRSVEFKAYQHSGIGIEDLALVPFGRSVGTLGFSFKTGNRGLTDFNTNLPGTGVPVAYSAIQGGVASAPRAGQGLIKQGVGFSTPVMPNENFAAYAQPGDQIQASATVFRPPSFDLRLFSVEISGWLASKHELSGIIDHLSR